MTCINNLTLLNITNCGCYDTFNETDDNFCVCSLADAKPNSALDQCFVCAIENCNYCSADSICEQCSTNFTMSSNNKTCACQTNETSYNGFCYTCNPSLATNCSVCNATNFCQTCVSTFTNINGICSCATGFTYSSTNK